MRAVTRKPKRATRKSIVSKSNINKNVIKNIITLHLSRKSRTGQRKPAELGAGQFYSGAGSNPFISFPSLTYSGGVSGDALPGLLTGEQTAARSAIKQYQRANAQDDVTIGGVPLDNTYMSPARITGTVQGRSVAAPRGMSPTTVGFGSGTPRKLAFSTPSQTSNVVGTANKLNSTLESLINTASLSQKIPQPKQELKPKKQKTAALPSAIAAAVVDRRDQPGKGRDIKLKKPFTPSK